MRALVSELEATRWTGRPGYPIRSMVGMALAKPIYGIPTRTRTVALVREHAALRTAIALPGSGVPSVYACYRFTAKLRLYSDMLTGCIDRVTAGLAERLPEYGRNVAIDGSDMPAFANGQRYRYDGCEDRDVRPIIPLKQTPGRQEGLAQDADVRARRLAVRRSGLHPQATKWRCPTGECKPASVWIKAERMFALIPRETLRWTALYRRRAAVEREFGRLKHEWALPPLRVRGLDRVRLHADLTILAKLACTLARTRAVALAA